MLTLQGAVAHCDMPVETGPTLYLPHSQKYAHGYLAYWLDEFQELGYPIAESANAAAIPRRPWTSRASPASTPAA